MLDLLVITFRPIYNKHEYCGFSFDLVNNKLIFVLIGAKRSSNYVRPTSY